MPHPNRTKRRGILLNAGLFVLVVAFAFFVRTWHYNGAVAQLADRICDVASEDRPPADRYPGRFLPRYHKNFAPFTIESAMMYSYAQDIAQGKGVPARDETLRGMEDIPPYAQMNMALEWFLGWGWRIKNTLFPDEPPDKTEILFQDHPRMAQFMSAQLRLWASLTSGLIFVWLIILHAGRRLALFGGLLHAVSLAAVARSTGQDIVRGEFCIPLIVGAFVLGYSLYRRGAVWKYVLLFVCVFLAFVSWDLSRMLFGAWALFEILHVAFHGRVTRPRRIVWSIIAAAILLNALFVPFNRTYELWRSQLVWILLPTLFAGYLAVRNTRQSLFPSQSGIRRIGIMVLTASVLFWIWSVMLNTEQYQSHYSHFSEVMKAKVEHWNVKPRDPEKLSYDARILWTPSMHSATKELVISFFPGVYFGRNHSFVVSRFFFCFLPVTLGLFTLLLTCGLLFTVPRRAIRKELPRTALPLLFTCGFFVGFLYVVRYHEFVILFLAVGLPLLLRDYLRAFRYAPAWVRPDEAYTLLYAKRYPKIFAHVLVPCFCAAILLLETTASLLSERRYTGDVAMRETALLIAYLRHIGDDVKGQGIAAGIMIEPMLKAYAGAAVVMNPQFGLKRIRDATEEYLTILYHGTERDLYDYCRKRNAQFVIFHRGMLNDMGIYSSRYIACGKDVPYEAPASLMYYRPDHLRYFTRITPPSSPQMRAMSIAYTIFRVNDHASILTEEPDSFGIPSTAVPVSSETPRPSRVIPLEKETDAKEKANRAWTFYLNGNETDAKALLREALSLDPKCESAILLQQELQLDAVFTKNEP